MKIASALCFVVVMALTFSAEAQREGGARGRGVGPSEGAPRQGAPRQGGPRQGAPRQTPSLPRGTAVHRDLQYVTNGHLLQTLDLYVPRSNSPVPLIVFVHGGGFSAGDKADQDPRPFVSDGYAFASVNYRLSGDAIFPAQIEDCKAAVRWLRANAARFNLDPERFGAWGTSAGGHLVALLGTAGDTTVFDVGENLEFSSRVQAVADWFGPTDFLQMDAHRLPDGMGHDAPGSPESRLIGGPIQQNKDKVARANPITYVSSGDPPFLIAHGDQDRLVPPHQSELLHSALMAERVPSTLIVVRGGGHGFRNAGADRERKEFFAKHLKRGETK